MDNGFLIDPIYNYAQIDEQGYCIGLSTLSGEVDNLSMILLSDEDNVQLGQKYDMENKVWLDEVKEPEPLPPMTTLDDVNSSVEETKGIVETSSSDNLINMDMLLGLDEKLNLILEHLGLIS